ncbi:enoyl-CoA hydratase/isomerase family protein [Streptomyces sp. NPDC005012]|uniref:enoyl-CoA hydratase/isomerase family protein n=1 Tax=Streptomyces sp. NPDC005012 TaxID=3154558 RepID=UPI0033A6A4C2
METTPHDPPPVLLSACDAGVLTLTLNRPDHRNALDHVLARRLLDALAEAAADPTLKVLVLTGAGTAFCAGDDLAATARWRAGEYADTPADPRTHEHLYLSVCRSLLTLPVPVVIAANGPAIGAGLSLLCAADHRIASRAAVFGTPALRHGHLGDAALLTRAVGPTHATRLHLTGATLDAEEATRIGLVDRVVAPDELPAAAAATGAELAALPPGAFALFKRLREQVLHAPTDVALLLQDRGHHESHRLHGGRP